MFGGVAAGTALVVLPIFINEIAETREKAALLTFTIELWRTLGILFGFVLGFYLPYHYVNVVGCMMSCVFSLCFPFVQESPHYFMRKGNLPALEKSLRWYRGIRDMDDREKPDYLQELSEFKAEMKGEGKGIGSEHYPRSYVVRLIGVSFLLTICAKLSGVFVELNYAADFLGRTGYTMELNYVLLSISQCIGAVFARLVGPKMPRKVKKPMSFSFQIKISLNFRSSSLFQVLLCLSSLLAAVPVILLALFKHFQESWSLGPWSERTVPIILLAIQLFFVSFGLYPLAAVVSSEVLPTKVSNIIAFVSVTQPEKYNQTYSK